MTKPAPRRQEARRDRALESDEFPPGKDRFELAGGNQRKKSWRRMLVVAVLGCLGWLEPEPVETVGWQGQKIGARIDCRKETAGSQLDGHGILEFGEIELNCLRRPRYIGDAEDPFALEFPEIDQDFPVRWIKKAQRAPPERHMRTPHRDDPPHPRQKARWARELRFDIDGAETINRVLNRGQEELGRVGPGEAPIPVARPLHRRAYAVPIAEIDIVAHADSSP